MTESFRIRTTSASYAYRRGRTVLGEVSFDVRPGEVVGILGRNGSGKTTCLRLLAGLLEPSTGRVVLESRPAVVTDRTPFLKALTARENIRGTLKLSGRSPPEAERLAESSLQRFGLVSDAGRPVEEFSLGMRRRLALAEGFATGRDILLLDEPTLGLDPAGRDDLASILDETASLAGAAVVVASNDADFAERVCDRVLFLQGGRIAARGVPAEMIARLGAPTFLDIETAGTVPGTKPPNGLALVERSTANLTLSGREAGRRLPDVWAWLESEGCSLREVKIREPGLADVYRAHTGEELPSPHEST